MGLNVSHDCWNGPYSAFNRWRVAIANYAGIDLPGMFGFGGETPWEDLPADPLYILLNHSDCDGIIEWKHAKALANRLEELMPKILDEYCRQKAVQFVQGLREAVALQEDVKFH